MNETSSSIRGIHYEVSKPVKNRQDGYFYQRVRQVDANGNLVGIGEQIHRSTNRNSEDGLFASPLDLEKLGMLAGDAGQALYGGLARDIRTLAIGVTRFARDAASGVTDGYKSWPGTHKPWEPILDWRAGSSGVDFVQDVPGEIGDGRGIGNWRENLQAVPRTQPRTDRWPSVPVPDVSPPSAPRAPEWNKVFVRDSARGAGVPSRNNVFEYGYPDSSSAPISESQPVRKLSARRVHLDGAFRARALADTMAGPERIDASEAWQAVPSAQTNSSDWQRPPRGLPAMLAEIGGFDLSNSAPSRGGLFSLIQDHLRNR